MREFSWFNFWWYFSLFWDLSFRWRSFERSLWGLISFGSTSRTVKVIVIFRPLLSPKYFVPLFRSDVNWTNFLFGGVLRYHWTPCALLSVFTLRRSLHGIYTCVLFDDIGDDSLYGEFPPVLVACVSLFSPLGDGWINCVFVFTTIGWDL